MNGNGQLTIAINALTELTPRYGSRVYLLELTRALTQTPGVRAVLLVGRGQTQNLPADLQASSVEVRVPAGRSYWQLPFARRISKTLKTMGADVWYVPNTMPIVSKRCTTIVTIHDLADVRVKKYGKVRTWYRLAVNALAARIADHVTTVSNNSKQDIVELLKIPPSKIAVVCPGVSERFRVLDRMTCRERISAQYRLPAEFILAPGGLARNKNVEGLLRAFAEVRPHIPHSLVLTGQADAKRHQELARAVEQLHLDGRVLFTGYIPDEDLPALYNSSAVVAYLSSYEGFGLPILEAMACGVPVVASGRSSIPEAAGDAALLVNPDDPVAVAMALEWAITDELLRNTLISRGLERVREFSWRRTAEQTLAVCASALNQQDSPAHTDWSFTPQDEVIRN